MSSSQNTRLSRLSVNVGLALLVTAAAAAAQDTSTSPAGGMKAGASLAASDKGFVEKAAIGGLGEVEFGKLAQQKGSSDQLKQFGSRMVDDHSKANDELKQIASAKGVTLPTELDAKHKNKMANLQKLSGAQFDRAYMDDMVADHREDVADVKKESTAAKGSDLKAFAAKTLPTLEDHLRLAQSTDAAVESAKSTASR